jgi:hypothetical protein
MKDELWRLPIDRQIELSHLAVAEKTLADGERHIEREEQN